MNCKDLRRFAVEVQPTIQHGEIAAGVELGFIVRF
jgi:hypothetical protein